MTPKSHKECGIHTASRWMILYLKKDSIREIGKDMCFRSHYGCLSSVIKMTNTIHWLDWAISVDHVAIVSLCDITQQHIKGIVVKAIGYNAQLIYTHFTAGMTDAEYAALEIKVNMFPMNADKDILTDILKRSDLQDANDLWGKICETKDVELLNMFRQRCPFPHIRDCYHLRHKKGFKWFLVTIVDTDLSVRQNVEPHHLEGISGYIDGIGFPLLRVKEMRYMEGPHEEIWKLRASFVKLYQTLSDEPMTPAKRPWVSLFNFYYFDPLSISSLAGWI